MIVSFRFLESRIGPSRASVHRLRGMIAQRGPTGLEIVNPDASLSDLPCAQCIGSRKCRASDSKASNKMVSVRFYLSDEA